MRTRRTKVLPRFPGQSALEAEWRRMVAEFRRELQCCAVAQAAYADLVKRRFSDPNPKEST